MRGGRGGRGGGGGGDDRGGGREGNYRRQEDVRDPPGHSDNRRGGERGGGRGGREEKRERKGEDSNMRKGGKWEEEQKEGGKREGEERGRQSGGDQGGSQDRDPRDQTSTSTPMINFPQPTYPYQRFPPGLIMDIPQVHQIPLNPNYYQQPPPQTTQLPLPQIQTPLPPQLGLPTVVQQAMLEYQRRYNILQ